MDKPVCNNCRHFQEGMLAPWCASPHAVRIDRIRGPVYPHLGPDVTDKCDEEGWFEKRRPWWVF